MKRKTINYIHFDTLDSTNTWTKKNAASFDPDKITCVTAEEQTAGKGRGGNKWHSPKGQNLYATLYFTLPLNTQILPNLAQALSISCVKVLQKMGFQPQIKWPNDLLLAGKKMAGILCETVSFKGYIGIVLGIGINLNMTEELLLRIDQPATSLSQLSGKTWSIEQMLEPLIQQFLEDLSLLQEKGFSALHKDYMQHLAYKGKEITCQDGKKSITGILSMIDQEGRLQLMLPGGEIVTLSSVERIH